MRTRAAFEIATAGISIRYRRSALATRLTSSLRAVIRPGVTSASSSVWPSRTDAISTCSRPSKSTSEVAPPVAVRSVSTASLQAVATCGSQSSHSSPGTTPIRSPEASALASTSPKRTPPSSLQSAASRQSGPETIVVVCGTWWPSIVERPNVGFSPVSPQ